MEYRIILSVFGMILFMIMAVTLNMQGTYLEKGLRYIPGISWLMSVIISHFALIGALAVSLFLCKWINSWFWLGFIAIIFFFLFYFKVIPT